MKFECSAQELYSGLVNATRALSAKPVSTILEGVSLSCNPEDGIELVCSDGAMTITSRVGASVADGGKVVLPGRLFTEIVRKMPDGTVKFTLNDKMVMNIKSNSGKANIAGTDADFPETEDLSGEAPIHLPREELSGMIAKVAFSIASDESRPQLTGCYFELTKNELRMVALDGFRLALQVRHGEYILPDGTEMVKAIIPGKTVNEIQHILDGASEQAVTLRFSKTHLMVTVGTVSLVSTLLAGEYINYRQILPTSWLTRVTVKRRELLDATERAALIAREGKNNLIKLETGTGEIRLTSNSAMGDMEETMMATVEGEEIQIAFNARYLTDVLRNVDADCVTLCMNTNVSPCVISQINSDAYLYLILPVRVYN